MAATVTLTGDWLQNIGSINQTSGTLTLGTYATGGVSVTPAMLGLGSFVGAPRFNAAGYVFVYDSADQKVLAYRSAGFTPAGTNSTSTAAAQTFTGTLGTAPTFTVTKGAILASSELGLSADATSATVNNNTIAATRILAAANSPVGATTPAGTNSTSSVSAQTFTGTAVAAAALVEVANLVNLAAVTVSFTAQGR